MIEYKTYEDYTILVGKNKYDNWDILDMSLPTDIMFHLENASSKYVLLKTTKNIRSIPKKVINYCKVLCRKTQKEPVFYVKCKNIIKGKNIGSFIVIGLPYVE